MSLVQAGRIQMRTDNVLAGNRSGLLWDGIVTGADDLLSCGGVSVSRPSAEGPRTNHS